MGLVREPCRTAGRGRAAKRGKAEANQAAERSEDPGRQGGRQGESAEGQDTEGQGKAPKVHKIQVEVEKVAFNPLAPGRFLAACAGRGPIVYAWPLRGRNFTRRRPFSTIFGAFES